MKLQIKNTSSLKMENLTIDEITFNRNKLINSKNLNVDFKTNFIYNGDKDCMVTLIGQVKTKEDANELSLMVKISARFYFEENEEIDADTVKFLMERNTVSILFPFLRSTISTITCQPNLQPIIIPPMNVNDLLNE